MSYYLLTLLGVILLGVLVDVILPSGSTAKYISGIFSIFVVFVIINPLLSFIKNGYNLRDYFSSEQIELDGQLLFSFNKSKIQAVEQDIEQELASNGYEGVDIQIQFEITLDEDVEITQVLADISNLVINANSVNINKYVYIRQVVMSKVAVSEEVIVFCE